MKKPLFLWVALLLCSVTSGILMSKASWIGRVGMTFFYKEYNFMKIWWQGAIAVFICYLLLFTVHTAVNRKLDGIGAKLLHSGMLLVALAGLYFSYQDFHHTLTHRLLRWHFHYGIYMFWAGWMLMSLYFIIEKGAAKEIDNKAASNR